MTTPPSSAVSRFRARRSTLSGAMHLESTVAHEGSSRDIGERERRERERDLRARRLGCRLMDHVLDDSIMRVSTHWMQLFDVEFNASSGRLSFFDVIQRAALETVSCAWRDQVQASVACHRLVIPQRW